MTDSSGYSSAMAQPKPGLVICFPEAASTSVRTAIQGFLKDEGLSAVAWLPETDRDHLGREFEGETTIECRYYDARDTLLPYRESLQLVLSGKADGTVTGASISKREYLHMLLSEHRQAVISRLFSLAPIWSHIAGDRRFFILDAVVRIRPSPHVLADAVSRASGFLAQLIGRAPHVCFIANDAADAHAADASTPRMAIQILRSRGHEGVVSTPVQIDTALGSAIRQHKLGPGYPDADLLVFPDLTSANAVFKCIDLFGDGLATVSGGLLHGLRRGMHGILSRSCGSHHVEQLLHFMVEVHVLRTISRRQSCTDNAP